MNHHKYKVFNHAPLNEKITIVTSIAPRDIDIQKKAIESWLRLGFEVVSMNVSEEIELLKQDFVEIQFVEANRSAKSKYGKPYIYFDDILSFFQEQGSQLCGIVNSDIHLFGDDLKSIVCQEAINSLLYGHRVEVKSLENLEGPMYEDGFDYFFFDSKIIPCYPKEEICLGQPWWDYWAILHPVLNAYQVKKLLNPVAYHVTHSTNWNQANWLQIADVCNKYFPAQTPLTAETISSYVGLVLSTIHDGSNFVVYNKSEKFERSVCIVFDNKGVNFNESFTYQSIMAQTYQNYSVHVGNMQNLKLDQINEEFICFIEEGYILNEHFVEAVLTSIDDEDFAACGIVPQRYDETKFYGSVFPIHNFDGTNHLNYKQKFGTIYRVKSFIKNNRFEEKLVLEKKLKVLGLGLISTSINNLFQGEHIEKRNKKIYIYGAGSHTRELLKNIDFDGYEIGGIIDKNAALDGQELYGYKIFNVNRLDDIDYDYILISSCSYEKQIFDELRQKINQNKLIRIYYQE